MDSKFFYVTYIRSTKEKIWEALLKPEFTRIYFFNSEYVCEWKVGARWKLQTVEGKVNDTGEVLEFDPPNRYVLSWQNLANEAMNAEGVGRCEISLEQAGDSVKLTVIHQMPVPDSKTIAAVSGGWPKILAGLKSLLETGKGL